MVHALQTFIRQVWYIDNNVGSELHNAAIRTSLDAGHTQSWSWVNLRLIKQCRCIGSSPERCTDHRSVGMRTIAGSAGAQSVCASTNEITLEHPC
jgi:hypothetical protein